MAQRRIMRELNDLQQNPMEGITVETVGNDMFHMKAQIRGPPSTPYENGIFTLNIEIPFDYPLKPPKCQFGTKIYHPNIGQNGEICLDILKGNWKPNENLKSVLQNIYYLFATPDPNDSLITDIATQYKNDKKAFEKTAEEWTKQYATGQ